MAHKSTRFMRALSEWTAPHRTMAIGAGALCVATAMSVMPPNETRLDALGSTNVLSFHRASAAASSASGLLQQRRCDSFQHMRLQREYHVERTLGQGGFGLVQSARHKASNARVAVKTLNKACTTSEKFWQEVSILKQVGGTHSVLKMHDAFETADSYVLVTELVKGGELFDHLVTEGAFSENKARAMMKQLCSAVAFLHSRNVVHADLKPENILLGDSEEDIRLIDFGLSFHEHDERERKRSLADGVGTVAYAAPEFIAMEGSDTSIDMWGLGMVLYIVLCGHHPFDRANNATDDELRERILLGKFDTNCAEWKSLSPSVQDLINQLLEVDPVRRASAVEALEHPWFAEES